jgi:signal peptidase I
MGSFMTLSQGDGGRSPLVTVWFSPRQTIEHVVATRPTHLVWVLAILGMIATIYSQIVRVGVSVPFADWRFWLAPILLGVVGGIVLLYLSALILNWVGRLLGGRAPARALRAVLAWSALPNILGFLIALIIIALNGNAVIVRALVVAFGLWGVVVFLLMLARVQHFGFWRTITAYVLNLIVLLVMVVLFRTFLYQPFNIPAASMAPTLLVGDYFFAAKFAYGYSRFSLPFSPPLPSGRVLATLPERGDVVVFRAPKDTATDYVKRVVGLPGDRIQMRQGLLFINDVPVSREPLADYDAAGLCGPESSPGVKRWRETLPNGASYETLDCVDNGFLDNTKVYTVPAGHLFVLGDNRDNSTDSRIESALGYVPVENLVGRASVIFFSRAPGSDEVRLERLGTVVR